MPTPVRILLVEDNVNDTELTLFALGKSTLAEGVATVRDGTKALDYLYRRGEFAGRAAGQPMLVMLDLKMPRMSGMEVLRQLKNDPDLMMIPVVVFSSSTEPEDRIRTYRLGANAYVVKPVSFSKFIDAIRELGRFWTGTNVPPPVCYN